MAQIPFVIDHTGHAERSYDIYSRLLEDRIIFLRDVIDDDVANVVIAQILFLAAKDPSKDIRLYINSPGGVVTAGLAVYDTMRFVKCDVATICIGQAASMAAVLLAAGAEGKRSALPNARILLHQASGGAQGQASDVRIQTDELLRIRDLLVKILSDHTGKPKRTIQKDTDRDYYMSASEAIAYGLIDRIVPPRGG
ncbi:ATP-dependent Clp protease proteolytic subunit [Candidatus Bipolaricaulota bacterium]|nr:ATP-dependent Clp protease proteolytic subunit [Candidatus Bipolaricaulota bacterium]TFH09783.1 MAG: ATP-dependent Clp protease proteolytic subunit [Candidatus Atribacteria bacterium]